MKRLQAIIILVLFVSCHSSKLPTREYPQYKLEKSYDYKNDLLEIQLSNPLKCPLRIWIKTSNAELQTHFDETNPVVLNAQTDTIITYKPIDDQKSKIYFPSRLGDVDKEIKPIKLELPFPKGKKYKITQGNNSNYTHNSDWSRYAVDFNLKINDTVCSATSGFVVGVVDKYENGGKGKKWKSFGNFITIYEPNTGVFTQYVHLIENGSFVKIGDEIKQGQPLGLSGKTGQTDIEHLHFNCLIPVNSNDGLKSIPFKFVEGYKSEDVRRGDLLSK